MELRLKLCAVVLVLINTSSSSYIVSSDQNQVIGTNSTLKRNEKGERTQ
jgi:hypothetical protein